ncbi:hypothetical protein [Isoptericola sp. 178]|uniref:hypothetical protein n=1 Tax=Isoptericola sp. 178 TaxID=3064651 RepID=UPI0027129AE8|nr:hypothetical protein [Isoptericola sp. 178]MDO8143654.1 hypothetical protein [Isoptericola sp. 178]
MNDDELIDRLRRTTAQVPPSQLDLEEVLRSSRRKRLRYRATLAAGCVAAVAAVGAVVPAASGALSGVWDGDDGTAVAAGLAGCAEDDLRVRVTATAEAMFITSVQPVVVPGGDEQGRRTGEALAGRPAPGVPRVTVDGAADAPTTAIVEAVAAHHADMDRRVAERRATEGLPSTEPTAPPGEAEVPEQPGRHLVYTTATTRQASGRVGCGTDVRAERAFYMAVSEPEGSGVVSCAEPAEDPVEAQLKVTFCVEDLTDDEQRMLPDPDEHGEPSFEDELGLRTLAPAGSLDAWWDAVGRPAG